MTRPVTTTAQPVAGWPLSRLLVALAFILLLLMVFVAAGVWKGGPGWLGWAGLDALALAFLVP